jgi:hypothetical protein
MKPPPDPDYRHLPFSACHAASRGATILRFAAGRSIAATGLRAGAKGRASCRQQHKAIKHPELHLAKVTSATDCSASMTNSMTEGSGSCYGSAWRCYGASRLAGSARSCARLIGCIEGGDDEAGDDPAIGDLRRDPRFDGRGLLSDRHRVITSGQQASVTGFSLSRPLPVPCSGDGSHSPVPPESFG